MKYGYGINIKYLSDRYAEGHYIRGSIDVCFGLVFSSLSMWLFMAAFAWKTQSATSIMPANVPFILKRCLDKCHSEYAA